MIPPWYVRLRCWLFGHSWVGERRADPVITLFVVCRRCGKWERLTVRDALTAVFGPTRRKP